MRDAHRMRHRKHNNQNNCCFNGTRMEGSSCRGRSVATVACTDRSCRLVAGCRRSLSDEYVNCEDIPLVNIATMCANNNVVPQRNGWDIFVDDLRMTIQWRWRSVLVTTMEKYHGVNQLSVPSSPDLEVPPFHCPGTTYMHTYDRN